MDSANDVATASATAAASAPAPTGGFSALAGGSAPAPAPTPAATPAPVTPASPASAPANTPQPSKWERILSGALIGMVGGAGQKFFGTGMAAGGAAVMNYNQQQTENQQRQQQIDQQQEQINIQQQEQPYKIKFMSAQAASLAADASMKDKQLHSYDQDHQQILAARSLDLMKSLSDMGIEPTQIIANVKGGQPALAAMQDMTAKQGGVPPMFTVVLGDKIVGYDLNQLTKQPQILNQINGVRSVTGQAPIDQQTWAQLPDAAKIQQTNTALDFWNPMPSEDNLAVYKSYLATAKAAAKSRPENQANVDKLQGIVDDMGKVLDESNQRAIDNKNKVTADTSKADAAAAGAKSYAASYGAEKGRNQADLESFGQNGNTDMFGNTIGGPGIDKKEYNKRVDSYNKDYAKDLNQLDQAGAQLNGIIANAEATGKLPGAASVVGLFDAIGISSAPLKGRGFRISNEIVGEHAGARNALQSAAIKMAKVSPDGTGQVVTLQQLKDYASILDQARHDAYVGAADQAISQHIGVQSVPLGHNRPLDANTMSIFMTLANNDPAKAAAAARNAGWLPPKGR